MRSDMLLFLVWILFLLGTQLLKKKKRPLKKVLPPVRRQDPGSFVCEEAQAPAVKEPPLQPSVAPQVAETRQRRPEPVRHPALSGGLRQGMLWSLVLGEPRSKKSWAREQREKKDF